MRFPSGREIAARPLSGLDRMALRLEASRAETPRDRFALAYAVVALAVGVEPRPRFALADLIVYGERACAAWEGDGEDVERLLEMVLGYAGPVLVPPGPTVEAVDAAGKGDAPPAGA